MVKDKQVRELMKRIQKEQTLSLAAIKSGMDRKTAKKYRNSGKLPSQSKKERHWRTRSDVFWEVWPEVEGFLVTDPSILATTLFDYLCRRYEGKFQEGHLRTLQRQIKVWKATKGSPQEVMFPQTHRPGELCESDFTDMRSLGITINGQPFPHLLFHFALTYSNWESATICFSESYEALSEGFQNGVWELGGVPHKHRTDCLSAAINNQCDPEQFTERYSALMNHYRIEAAHINPGRANENGDVEQSHHRFKLALAQELILRGSKDFRSREQYVSFLQQMLRRRNAARREKVQEELAIIGKLPDQRLEDFTRVIVKVSRNSTINVRHNIYSVDSRLIGERVEVRVYAENLQIWYSAKKVDEFERMRGESNHKINYRHIIDSLIKKPGAFANYRYQSDLFPRTVFRTAYDELRSKSPATADRQYLRILQLAALRGEEKVYEILHQLIRSGESVSDHSVEEMLEQEEPLTAWQVAVDPVSVASYDSLLDQPEVNKWATQ
jgi:hypothetical protein